jgi:hypothetical protein
MTKEILKTDNKDRFSIKFKWECSENITSIKFEGFEKPDEDLFFTGFIKFDGCMEIHDLNYHFCFRDDILQRVVNLIYDTAKEIMKDNGDFN